MGRPRKNPKPEEVVEEKNLTTPLFKRDINGLVEGLEYHFLPNGLVDWEKMINPAHTVLFKDKRHLIEKQYGPFAETQTKLQAGEVEVDSKFKLVLLQGWRELAIVRGYRGYEYTHFNSQDGLCSVACKIYWIGNFETEMTETFSVDGADASIRNTNDFAQSYLTTIACNRAFGRAVRSYLNINILGADEISEKSGGGQVQSTSGGNDEVSMVPNPSFTLEKFAKDAGIKDFGAFKIYLFKLIKKGYEVISEEDYPKWKEYNSFEDIPKRTCIGLIGKLRTLENDRD